MTRKLQVLLFVFLLLSCSSQVKLLPIGDKVADLPNAASEKVADISVLIETQAWSGDPAILPKVTPVRVTIQNKSGNLIRVRSSEFAFVSDNGQRYSALPPYDVKGSVEKPVPPGFTCDHFMIAPYYSGYYPDMEACPDDFSYDQAYYENSYPNWVQFQLPTRDMLRMALPDGVVDVGGYVSGFLYFQNISTEEQHVKFIGKLINAVNGDLMGTVNVPFKVVKK
jgi:hypothetical protein